jgi:hypothetical protein
MEISSRMNRDMAEHYATPVCVRERAVTSDALAPARAEAVTTVRSRYLALASGAEPVTDSTVMRNVPRSRWSVGLIGGGMVTRGGHRNFEIRDKAISQKDLSGLVTAAVIHWHPFPYNPVETDITWAERVSVLGGFATTPSAGFAAGASFRAFRGLGFHASHVWLRSERLRPDFQPGQEVVGDVDPFRLGFTRAVVLGFSYDFK